MTTLPTTELRIAFAWTCDTCGRDTYEQRAMLDDDEPRNDDTIDSFHVVMPTQVTCSHCKAQYRAAWREPPSTHQ